MFRKSPLNRAFASGVIRLLDYCFKQGVIDACDLEDDYTAKEWLTARLEDGGYGLLSEIDTPFDWKRWRFVLYRWCRNARIGTLGEGYIDKIRKKQVYYFAVLPISMRFYLMGIEEWLEYPNPNGMTLFRSENRIHWKPMPSHLKVMRTDDFISYIQEFIYERQSRHFQDDLSDARYDSFCSAIWNFTRKYPVYGDIRDDIEAAKNI